MDARPVGLRASIEADLWPLLEPLVGTPDVAGLAVAVVRDEEVVARGFGVRDVGTGAPVTPETMFHLASVSKPFVATAVVSLAASRPGPAVLDLDAPITEWVPELSLADGREREVTARGLLSHTSGLPDVTEYGWHDPRLGDDALAELARSLSHWRLRSEPGTTFSYSNAGYELLGLQLSRVTGTTFEEAVRQRVLHPLGMERSTFLRSEVPPDLAASAHVGMPLTVPGAAYPYTRCHAPSSTLHSSAAEMARWIVAHWARLDPGLLDLMWRPVVQVGRPPWEEAAGLGWALGSYRGHRTVSHSGTDPGFGSMLVLVPEQRTGVVVLANSNAAPVWSVARAALDVVLAARPGPVAVGTAPGQPGGGVAALRAFLPSAAGPVAGALATSGREAALATYHRLASAEPAVVDLDDEVFMDAVWGAIELHRTDLVWPLLRVWAELRPDSSGAWTMTGWAHQMDGRPDVARENLRRALALDPDNEEAATLMDALTPESASEES